MSNSPINMLVADDSRVARLIFRDVMADAGATPVNVIDAADGRECMEHLARGNIDLAFIDVHMPHMSGLEALWGARNMGLKTFITLMSGSVDDRLMTMARNLRAYDFLFKPFERDDVEKVIEIYRRLCVPMRALVVDDSATVRRVIQRVLAASLFHIDFAEAPDGTAALARCAKGDVDIVFLDCNMPGLDGLETLARLITRDPHIKIIMISGEWNDEHEREALKRGAIAFLHKPFRAGDVDTLLHAVYGVPSPNLNCKKAGLLGQFDIAISGRTICVTHKQTGHIYEYLWFRNVPHLRMGHVRENKAASRFSPQIRADAEKAALIELKQAKLVEAVSDAVAA
jgi:CheY-like chemotaxis protein